jgi:acetylornithine deacetylase/succinyl-diaminopimelate desuccinylase-like protein
MRRNLLFLLALVLPSTGCLAAAAAGAAGGVYLTSRGAESVVEGSVEQIAGRAEAVMSDMAIVKEGESTEDQGDKQVLKGKKGELDVTIEIKRESSKTAKVEVTARENLAEWNKDYAKEVLSQIVQKG